MCKPAGLLVHRSPEAPDRDVLLQRLRDAVGRRVSPVHRIDRATSGIVLFAFEPDVVRAAQAALHAPETRKHYLVLVRGETPARFESRRPLRGPSGERRPCWTEFERLATFSRCSLLRARLHTGRRHQIRRHLNHLAHQAIGDRRYGKSRINGFFRDTYGLERLFLHATALELQHPVTREALALASPLPPELRAFLARLPDVPPAVAELPELLIDEEAAADERLHELECRLREARRSASDVT